MAAPRRGGWGVTSTPTASCTAGASLVSGWAHGSVALRRGDRLWSAESLKHKGAWTSHPRCLTSHPGTGWHGIAETRGPLGRSSLQFPGVGTGSPSLTPILVGQWPAGCPVTSPPQPGSFPVDSSSATAPGTNGVRGVCMAPVLLQVPRSLGSQGGSAPRMSASSHGARRRATLHAKGLQT